MLKPRLSLQQPSRRFIFSLVFTLLLAQWLVFTHVHKQTNHAPDSICSVCLTGEHFNHALGNSVVLFNHQAAPLADFFVFGMVVLRQFIPAFRSRAPPVLR